MADPKLTESADERCFRNFFQKNSVYNIPFFQRPYRWKPAKLSQLQSDLLSTWESVEDLHFMGALILHRSAGNFMDIDEYQIIDGQQRITTIYLHVAAAVYVLSVSDGGSKDAWRLMHNYLINNEFLSQKPASFKLRPSRDDRMPLNAVLKRVVESKGIAAEAPLGLALAYLEHGAPQPKNNRIEKNYDLAVKFFRDRLREGGAQHVVDLVEVILHRMSVVVIEVVDPLSGPKIFDSLNSGQEPMTVGDLVRNDVFARGGDAKLPISDIEAHHWKPFFESFGDPVAGHFENYFFPFGLITWPNAKKSEVYQKMRRKWIDEKMDSIQVIDILREYQPDYMMLRIGRPLPEHPAQVGRAFSRLTNMGAPTAVYPFGMRLSKAVRGGSFDPDTCIAILQVIESFLIRRAVVGQEPTGLHAVFKRLWDDAEQHSALTAEGIRATITEAKTVQWPNDDQFGAAIRERRLYGVGITRYVLAELNAGLGGDSTDAANLWIEHVLPRSPDHGWDSFSHEVRAEWTDRLANLLPLTAEMNRLLSNGAYSKKRDIYLNDSKYKMTREFAKKHEAWLPGDLAARAESLVEQALRRWPFGPDAK